KTTPLFEINSQRVCLQSEVRHFSLTSFIVLVFFKLNLCQIASSQLPLQAIIRTVLLLGY
ncbi:hypothetical protein ACQV2S_08075, partial [Facklamia sp. P13064]|uniref:hypothetical protein n=1 Tax=Facklamia sp. P13064 TaxID=3421953 RepID=UPI003D17DB12